MKTLMGDVTVWGVSVTVPCARLRDSALSLPALGGGLDPLKRRFCI